MTLGDVLPVLRTGVPGPRSVALARRLARVESRNITRLADDGPIFWAEAVGANVRDVDDNVFVDLTAGFGVAAAGHRNPAVTRAATSQLGRLTHAMGDVHPAEVKVRLLERLAELAPGDLSVSILSADGSDAVESALKTAVLRTGRTGVIAFHGGYHGLGYGALSVTSGQRFRQPFEAQLHTGVRFAPFPSASGPPSAPDSAAVLAEVRRLAEADDDPVGAVVVEPIQGRAGVVVPPTDFLPGLRELCSEMGLVLILDEIYTGFGRTGRWFACEHDGVVPDILVVGKSLGGGLPLSAAIGTPEVMRAWPPSEGEAMHTSTFLGNPVAAAAALAQLREIEDRDLVHRAARLGDHLSGRLEGLCRGDRPADHRRGRGLMQALVLGGPDAEARAARVCSAALRAGIIVLPEGPAIALTPPLVITRSQVDHAIEVLGDLLDRDPAS